jgi:predicted kinase
LAEQTLTVIVLVGIPGSGKSALCNQFPNFIRINQDRLGNRNDCINALKRNLQQGNNCIIDRTNINRQQRQYFLDVAKDFGAEVYCIFLNIPAVECIERVKNRKDHETIKDLPDEKIIAIVSRFNKELELPEYAEGFKEIYHIHDNNECNALPGIIAGQGKTKT